ncbi:MAG TPA: type II toxin-antitoxin system RelE/ParE family toxin, partial [Balneolales bacterium]|nr:type II toxin-antitoxin system RelE/ParE family toxin [Balneolales bacterium]
TFEQVDLLHQYPKLGKSVQELEESIYRELLVSPCRIFYRMEDENIYIIHVMRVEHLLRIDLLSSR